MANMNLLYPNIRMGNIENLDNIAEEIKKINSVDFIINYIDELEGYADEYKYSINASDLEKLRDILELRLLELTNETQLLVSNDELDIILEKLRAVKDITKSEKDKLDTLVKTLLVKAEKNNYFVSKDKEILDLYVNYYFSIGSDSISAVLISNYNKLLETLKDSVVKVEETNELSEETKLYINRNEFSRILQKFNTEEGITQIEREKLDAYARAALERMEKSFNSNDGQSAYISYEEQNALDCYVNYFSVAGCDAAAALIVSKYNELVQKKNDLIAVSKNPVMKKTRFKSVKDVSGKIKTIVILEVTILLGIVAAVIAINLK